MNKNMFQRIKGSIVKIGKPRGSRTDSLEKKDEQKATDSELQLGKLKSEMLNLNKELANQTMRIIQKNKFLIHVNEELNSIKKIVTNDAATRKIENLKTRIEKEIKFEQQNKIFETYFGEVHSDFFSNLKKDFTDLTANDLRLCAYIKMNLTTREIAAILNITYRGVEIGRYRLRKKLKLDRSINLSSFLSRY